MGRAGAGPRAAWSHWRVVAPSMWTGTYRSGRLCWQRGGCRVGLSWPVAGCARHGAGRAESIPEAPGFPLGRRDPVRPGKGDVQRSRRADAGPLHAYFSPR
ncbi:protein of unknown function [Cupriavidus taiwanensis]|nr:protein of unknown function [Cupriavidus taiwanensis]